MIPEAVLNQIQDRADIVEIISAYTPMKRAGRNFKANCPFHGEKTPSFMVSPDKQIFHCFGCGAGGNVFGFLMKIEKKDFLEVVEDLALRTGIEIPKSGFKDSEADKRRDIFLKANGIAADFYHRTLLKDKAAEKARTYLKKRGITEQTVEDFKIGWAPETWDSFYQSAHGQIADGILEKAGLVLSKKEGSGFYDRFRSRVMFPILDGKGICVAFGGRVLDDSVPKYLNSPETEIYYKGRELYGLFQARKAIREKDAVMVVEGYMDVIACHQAGVQNVVASLGTALTPDQARLMKRHTKNVYILYDADKAGEMATLRGLEIFLEEDLEVKIVRLPEGHDPDSFIREYGREKFESEVLNAKNLFEYKLSLSKKNNDAKTIEGKIRIANEMAGFLAKVKNEISRSAWAKELARGLALSEEAVAAEIKKGQSAFKAGWKAPEKNLEAKEVASVKPSTFERMLLGLCLENEELASRAKNEIRLEDFKSETAHAVAEKVLSSKEYVSAANLLTTFREDAKATAFIASAIAETESMTEREKAFEDCVALAKRNRVNNRRDVLRAELSQAQASGDASQIQKILFEFNEINKGMKTQHEKK